MVEGRGVRRVGDWKKGDEKGSTRVEGSGGGGGEGRGKREVEVNFCGRKYLLINSSNV